MDSFPTSHITYIFQNLCLCTYWLKINFVSDFVPSIYFQVDGTSLEGFSNHQAVEVLRNTGPTVRLKLARFQHAPEMELSQYPSNTDIKKDIDL